MELLEEELRLRLFTNQLLYLLIYASQKPCFAVTTRGDSHLNPNQPNEGARL
jgi:hypothetical protein